MPKIVFSGTRPPLSIGKFGCILSYRAFFIVDQTKFYFDSTSSTPRTLEYVTIDRGNGNSNTRQEEEEEQFVTPLPELFEQPFEDEDEDQKDDERPRSGLQNVRELE